MVANVRIIHLEFVFIYIFKQRIQFYSVNSKWYGFFGREERRGGGGGGVGGAKDVPMARSLPPINPIRVEGGKGGGGGGVVPLNNISTLFVPMLTPEQNLTHF